MTNEPFGVDDVAEMPPPNPYLIAEDSIADHPRAGACGSSPPNPYALTVAELERYFDRDTLELQISFCKATGRHAQLAVFLEALELQQLLIEADATGDPYSYLPNYREVYEEYCRLRVLDAQRPRKQEPGAVRKANEPQARIASRGTTGSRASHGCSRETAKERNTRQGFTECEGETGAAPCRPLGRPQIAGGGSHRETAPTYIPSPVRGDRVGIVPGDPAAHTAGYLLAPRGAQQGTVPAVGDLIPRPCESPLTGNDRDSPARLGSTKSSAQTTAPGTVPLRLVGQSKFGLRPLRSRFGLKTIGLATLAMTGFGGARLRAA